jgi:hypothetical protein
LLFFVWRACASVVCANCELLHASIAHHGFEGPRGSGRGPLAELLAPLLQRRIVADAEAQLWMLAVNRLGERFEAEGGPFLFQFCEQLEAVIVVAELVGKQTRQGEAAKADGPALVVALGKFPVCVISFAGIGHPFRNR